MTAPWQSVLSTQSQSRRSVGKSALSPCLRTPTPLTQVLDRCLSLRHDLGSSLRTLQLSRPQGLHRQELDSPLNTRWNSSEKYKEVKERIRQKEVEERLHGLIPDLQTRRESCLFTRKNRVKTELSRKNQRVSMQVSAKMLGAFLLTGWLSKPRDFGDTAAVQKFDKNAETEEMQQFWRSDIDKYEKQRTDRLLKPAVIRKSRGLEAKPEAEIETNLSPLQLFVLNNAKRLKGEEQVGSTRKLRIAEKMRTIQPSAEVWALSLKYLPKHFKSNPHFRRLVKPTTERYSPSPDLTPLPHHHKHLST